MNIYTARVTVGVDSPIYQEILQLVERHVLPGRCSLFYEGQIPFVAFMVLDGTVKLLKRQKERGSLVPGDIFGIVEYFHRTSSRYEVIAAPGAELAVIDRSALQLILNQSELKASNFFHTVLSKK